jgi:hypothetical protein
LLHNSQAHSQCILPGSCGSGSRLLSESSAVRRRLAKENDRAPMSGIDRWAVAARGCDASDARIILCIPSHLRQG